MAAILLVFVRGAAGFPICSTIHFNVELVFCIRSQHVFSCIPFCRFR